MSSISNFLFNGGLTGTDPYSDLENQLRNWQGAVQYQPGMDYSNYAFARPYDNAEGPQAGSWMVPKDVYSRMSPQTSGGEFGLGGLLKVPGEIASGSLPGLAIPAVAAGVNLLAPAAVAGSASAGSSAGGGMNWSDLYDFGESSTWSTNPSTADLGGGDMSWANGGASGGTGGLDLGGGLSVDEFGNVTGGLFQGGPGTPGADDFFNPMGGTSLMDVLKSGGSNLLKLLNNPAGGGLLKSLGINSGSLLGSGLNTAARMAPGLMSLLYARSQPGIDTSGLEGVLGKLGDNHDAVVQAATDPFQKNIAAGYGDLVQSQGLRGIRGSSFGDTDIANYISTTGRALSNAGANAAEGSLALQGNLAGNIATLKSKAQQIKDAMYGRAFDVLGRGLNPTPSFSFAGP